MMETTKNALHLFDSLKKAVSENASDIHIKSDSIPYCRDSNGQLRPLDAPRVSEKDVISFCYLVFQDSMPISFLMLFEKGFGEADAGGNLCLSESIFASLRFNGYYSQTGLCLAIRVLRGKVLTMDNIMLPPSLRELRHRKEGIVIFCGATGSGKTTAMYSMLDAINRESCKHIITLDNPIEIVLKGRKSIISQREIGIHTDSFHEGLRSALREDPDILLVGEMRDKDTIRTALQAAETGHLVLTTIHAASVSEVVDRILSYFPAEEAPQLRSVLAASFLGIAACKLLPRKGGGRVAAFEVLLKTPATTSVIKDGNMMQIADFMSQGQGMQTMEQAMYSLRFSRLIDEA